MKRSFLTLSLILSTFALGADPKKPDAKAEAKLDPKLVEAGSKLYTTKTCVACHGKDAKSPILPDYPKLAGQNAAYAEKQILDIKSGARANGNTAAMKGIMHLVSDEEIKALAVYLQSLP